MDSDTLPAMDAGKKRFGLTTTAWKTILGLFLVTRLFLTGVGVASRELIEPVRKKPYGWVYSDYLHLDVWGVWDTGWYLGIARRGYPATTPELPDIRDVKWSRNYGFLPLYPLTIFLLHLVTGRYFLSALLASNLSLLVVAALLYRMAEERGGPLLARNTMVALFFFPASFILSGGFSESLCLALLLGCFALADRDRWGWVGVLGFLLALCRPIGVVMVIPLGMKWLARYRRLHPGVLFLGLIPAGLVFWSAFCYFRTGDWLAVPHVKERFWGAGFYNPFANLWDWVLHDSPGIRLNAIFGFLLLFLVLVLLLRRRWIEVVTCLLLLLVPIGGGGIGQATGILRFSVMLFPLYVLLGEVLENERLARWLTPCLGVIQGFLMVTWANGLHFIV